MRAETVNTVVEDDGVISLEGLPVRAGQRMQVIVLMPDDPAQQDRYPLRGRKPFRYDQPNAPIGAEDWEIES